MTGGVTGNLRTAFMDRFDLEAEIVKLDQRVEELERDAKKLEAWGRGLTARAEAAEANAVLLDRAATDYRKARDEAEAKLAEAHAAKTRAEESELNTAAEMDEVKEQLRLTTAMYMEETALAQRAEKAEAKLAKVVEELGAVTCPECEAVFMVTVPAAKGEE